MQTGMLWHDADKTTTLAEKLSKASAYYLNKNGKTVTECHVHPSMLPDGEMVVSGVRVVPSKLVMVNYFWVGRN